LNGSTSTSAAADGAMPGVATDSGASSGPAASGSGATLIIAKSWMP
jgi:hypothetical protein